MRCQFIDLHVPRYHIMYVKGTPGCSARLQIKVGLYVHVCVYVLVNYVREEGNMANYIHCP